MSLFVDASATWIAIGAVIAGAIALWAGGGHIASLGLAGRIAVAVIAGLLIVVALLILGHSANCSFRG